VISDELSNPKKSIKISEIRGRQMLNKSMKTTQLILAVSLCVFGGILLIAGFICPPLGEIHPTILTAFGEILTFSGALLGMDYKYRSKKE
jgi:hypothetical protein